MFATKAKKEFISILNEEKEIKEFLHKIMWNNDLFCVKTRNNNSKYKKIIIYFYTEIPLFLKIWLFHRYLFIQIHIHKKILQFTKIILSKLI